MIGGHGIKVMVMQTASTRIERVRDELERLGVAALLVVPGPDFFYLTGQSLYAGERLLALILPRQGTPLLLSPEMNVGQLEGVIPGAELRGWSDAEGYREPLERALTDRGLEHGPIAVDDEMRSAFLLDLQQECPDVRARHAGPVMRALRLRKDAEELALLARAGAIADQAIPAAQAACRPGTSESAVAASIGRAMEEHAPGAHCYGAIVAPELTARFLITTRGPVPSSGGTSSFWTTAAPGRATIRISP
jgi:Xaa-Pro dipeptidase